jgi:zinc protease
MVSKKTLAQAPWRKVALLLEKKYQGRVFSFDYPELESTRQSLAAYAPRYVCFVAQPGETTRSFVEDAAKLMRTLDPDPYVDAIWAIVTGYTPDDALRMAKAEPLQVARGVSHVTDGWLNWLEEGVSWSEVVKNAKYTKAKGDKVREVAGPDDTVAEIVAELNRGKSQIMSSSGHAREHDWQLGYTYRNGKVISKGGRLFGVTTNNQKLAIHSTNPKVYYSPGNCLIAHVADMDCMALAWMHSGGVNQFFGHIVPQYRACWAWEVGGYFFSLQGRFDFAESVHLFRQDVIARLEETTDEKTRAFLISDRDSTILYGDPAWQARVKPTTAPNYDQTLSIQEAPDGRLTITLSIRARRECAPSEPAAAFLPVRIKDASVVALDGAKAIVGKDFILLRLLREGEKSLVPTDTRSVTISASKVDKPAGQARRGLLMEPVGRSCPRKGSPDT